MASCGSRLIDGIRRLFDSQSPKKGIGRATESKGRPNLNGRIYGESPVRVAVTEFNKYRQMQKFHLEHTELWTSTSTYVANDCDEVAEVFLDKNGNIKEPLCRGVAFDFCKLDRWYMPDCIPGIISKVDITNIHPGELEIQGIARKIITVLHANDKYIHLAPCKIFYLEPDDHYYSLVETHFVRRGIDFIRESDVSSKDWEHWAKTFGTPYGQNTSTISIGSNGRGPQNPQVIAWGPGHSSYSFARTTGPRTSGP